MMGSDQYSTSDRALARSILALDVEAMDAALSAGATAHKTLFRDFSWALIPVGVSLQQREPSDAMTDGVRKMVRTLIAEGASIKGLSRLVGSGVHFNSGDMTYFLDNWLWRDADEVMQVARRMGDDDETMSALIETGHVPLDLLMKSGRPILEHAVERDMARSVYALCGQGADPNATIAHPSLGGVPAIEACVHDGRLRTALALLASGAFYDGSRLVDLASAQSEEFRQALDDGLRAFESNEASTYSDLTSRASFEVFAKTGRAISAAESSARSLPDMESSSVA